jgi:hypothetical protein
MNVRPSLSRALRFAVAGAATVVLAACEGDMPKKKP